MGALSIEVRGYDELIQYLKGSEKRFYSVIPVVVAYGERTLAAIKNYSPVDSGLYKNAWTSRSVYGGPNPLIEFNIENNLIYAQAVTFGSVLGRRPWFFGGPKTMVVGKKVFSTQAPTGVVDPIMHEAGIRTMLNQIADKVVGE